MARRRKYTRNGNGKSGRGGHNKSGMICWYCKKPMSSKNARLWSTHLVHKGSCYKNCCANLISGPNLIGKLFNYQPPQEKGFFDKNKYFLLVIIILGALVIAGWPRISSLLGR
jgi:hypothetical protein